MADARGIGVLAAGIGLAGILLGGIGIWALHQRTRQDESDVRRDLRDEAAARARAIGDRLNALASDLRARAEIAAASPGGILAGFPGPGLPLEVGAVLAWGPGGETLLPPPAPPAPAPAIAREILEDESALGRTASLREALASEREARDPRRAILEFRLAMRDPGAPVRVRLLALQGIVRCAFRLGLAAEALEAASALVSEARRAGRPDLEIPALLQSGSLRAIAAGDPAAGMADWVAVLAGAERERSRIGDAASRVLFERARQEADRVRDAARPAELRRRMEAVLSDRAIRERAAAVEAALQARGFVLAPAGGAWVLAEGVPWLVVASDRPSGEEAGPVRRVAYAIPATALEGYAPAGRAVVLSGPGLPPPAPSAAESAPVRLPPPWDAFEVRIASTLSLDAERLERLRSRASMLRLGVGALALGIVLALAFLAARAIRETREARIRTELVRRVGHELKTPLTTIRLLAEMLESGGSEPEEVRECLGVLRREVDRLSGLIEGILDFARVTAGRRAGVLREVDLAVLARDTLGAIGPQIAAGGFRLETDLPSPGPRARVDPDAMSEVLLNLLSNAMKYGGEERWIRVSLKRDGAQAVLSVEDRGIGIPAAERARVFEPFVRAENALSTGREG
ncbi:MAG: HAMP domain-containing sensor histidine kinase, partial [Planctomycetota bacterium]